MKTKIIIFSLTILIALFFYNCKNITPLSSNEKKANKSFKNFNNAISIIFETDIGNDVDDALAMDMIYKYLDEKEINLLAVCSNKDSKYSTEYIHLLNNWYGYPNIPIGKVINGIDSENDAVKYAEHVCLMKKNSDEELFIRPLFNHDSLPDAVQLYRKILARQPNSSVTIVSVGFSTNIVRLLKSKPDKYSKLTGKELIAKKVKLLSVMAGSFGEKSVAEYNVVKDIPAAKSLTTEWPTQIVFTPFEAGIAVTYPAKSIENDFKWTKAHPVVEAYKHYLPMPYDRPTWDLIALLYVTKNCSKYFSVSKKGNVCVDDRGFTFFNESQNGKHRYIFLNKEQVDSTRAYFVRLITKEPLKHAK